MPEFAQQDDYFLAHGASLMSDESHEILHIDTLRRIVAATMADAEDARAPLNDAQALELARKPLSKCLSWAPHITRCTDLEIRALIRAVEAAHGITADARERWNCWKR